MPTVELVAVGTELLLGQLVDTNTAFVAQVCAENGIDVFATHCIGDNRERIARVIRGVLDRSDGIITTGGLGPTVDDLTKEAVCDALDLDCDLHEPSLRVMEEMFRGFGRTMTENNRKQAMLPSSATALQNPNGTAPGFVALSRDGKFVACMPGVPREMRPMLRNELIPWLQERFSLRARIVTRIIHTINVGESVVDEKIVDLFRSLENPKIAVLAHEGRTDVKIMAKAGEEREARALIEPVEREIVERLRPYIYGYDDETPASAVHRLLRRRGATVSTAESCTGGRVGALLTAVPGASTTYIGGAVAYDNAVKQAVVGVPVQTLREEGAVSEATARAMAEGARERFATTYGVATTGIAGPDGGSDSKPVGLVWIAVSGPGRTVARRTRFPGERASIQSRSALAALGLLWKMLQDGEPDKCAET